MIPWLKTMTLLLEDLCSVPRTPWKFKNKLLFHFQKIKWPLLPPVCDGDEGHLRIGALHTCTLYNVQQDCGVCCGRDGSGIVHAM